MRRSRLTIRKEIAKAKSILVYLDPDYRQHDSAQPAYLAVTKKQANIVVSMSPRDNEPSGFVNDSGTLILEPPRTR